MKKRISLVLCLILSFSMILSTFTVFASAESSEETNQEEKVNVLLNRTFDEGWNYNNGLSGDRKSNNFFIDKEVKKDFSYNYFLRFEASNANDGYLQLNFGSTPFGVKHTYVEFDLKIDDTCDFGEIVYSRLNNGAGKNMSSGLLAIKNNKVCAFESEATSVKLKNSWTHIAIDYNYEDEALTKENKFKVNIYITPEGENSIVFTRTYNGVDGKMPYLTFFRFGIPTVKNGATRKDTSFCLDNLQAYCTDGGFAKIPSDNYGSLVKKETAKDIIIENDDGSSELSTTEYLQNSLCMKVGVDYALFKNERRPIYEGVYGAPVKVDGTVMIPLNIILEYIGYPYFAHEDGESFDISTGDSVAFITLGRKVATVDGKRIDLCKAPGYVQSKDGKNKYLVVSIDDIEKLFPGFYVTYDDMGLIIICKKDNILNREHDIKNMINLMKEFVFEYKTADEIYSDIVKTTNNFTHPFMIGNQAQFDMLNRVYNSKIGEEGYDEELKSYINSVVESAEKNYRIYAKPVTENVNLKESFDSYIGIKPEKLPTNPYPDSKGYDPAGARLPEASHHCSKVMLFAFAYQITRNEKYLKCMYDLALQMGTWDHWGPAHFLNCADASYPFALAIDWSYNAIEKLSKTDNYYSTEKLIDILYTHGTYQGYYSTVETSGKTLWPRNDYTISYYSNMGNNWNAVCTSGMTMSAIITAQKDEYKQNSMALLSNNFEKLCRNGLSQYAPDGSYVESPVYWSYGTNSLFKMAMVLESACGSDYGLMDCWGLDKTCYFACHTESSDYRIFNYHDGDVQAQDSYSFFFVSKMLDDPVLTSIRSNQLKGGKSATIYDLLYYPTEIKQTEELPLSYCSEGIDAYTVRSSWEKGSMFAGIIAGDNKASHGQVDSGSWVYHNLGKIWFCDLGNDEYNAFGYFSDDIRYRYYRMNAEGNNCLVLASQPKSMPYGQNLYGKGKIVEYETNEFGSYVIIDNSDVYDSTKNGGRNYVSYARRGMMSTNNGNTVIIQDEVSLKGIQSLYWFAHYNLNTVRNIKLSPDKRTAYLNDYDGNTIRVSLVSNTRDFIFEIMDCYTFVLNGNMGTVDKTYSTSKGGQPEYDRSKYMKLAIKAENTLSFNVAVVIEAINGENEKATRYEWCEMKDWNPAEFTQNENSQDEINYRDFPKRIDIKSGSLSLSRSREKSDIYGENIHSYYRLLTNTEYAYINYKNENLDAYAKEIEDLNLYVKEYDTFVKTANSYLKTSQNSINILLGI